MATNYPKLVATAQRLINNSGRSIIVQQLDSGPANPDKPWEGAGAPTVKDAEPVIGTFVPHTSSGFGMSFIDEELLKRVEQVVLVAQATKDIEKFHLIVDSNTEWRIDWAQVLKPANEVLLYAFGVVR